MSVLGIFSENGAGRMEGGTGGRNGRGGREREGGGKRGKERTVTAGSQGAITPGSARPASWPASPCVYSTNQKFRVYFSLSPAEALCCTADTGPIVGIAPKEDKLRTAIRRIVIDNAPPLHPVPEVPPPPSAFIHSRHADFAPSHRRCELFFGACWVNNTSWGSAENMCPSRAHGRVVPAAFDPAVLPPALRRRRSHRSHTVRMRSPSPRRDSNVTAAVYAYAPAVKVEIAHSLQHFTPGARRACAARCANMCTRTLSHPLSVLLDESWLHLLHTPIVAPLRSPRTTRPFAVGIRFLPANSRLPCSKGDVDPFPPCAIRIDSSIRTYIRHSQPGRQNTPAPRTINSTRTLSVRQLSYWTTISK